MGSRRCVRGAVRLIGSHVKKGADNVVGRWMPEMVA